jgi:S1-C subfamily serine protease
MKPSALLLLFLFFAAPLQAASLPDIIDRVRGSVVAVGSLAQPKYGKGQPKATYLGTGFAVSDGGLVVTNHHVVTAVKTEKGQQLAVFSGRGKEARVHTATWLRSDQEHDLALLRIGGPRLPAMKLGGNGWLREGEEVALTGFPIGMVLGLYPVTHRGIISAITPAAIPASSSRQLSAARLKRLRNPYDVYQLDAIAYPGNSGSPVYKVETGEVIGVLNSVFVKGSKESILSSPSGISYAIPVKYVHRLLKGK